MSMSKFLANLGLAKLSSALGAVLAADAKLDPKAHLQARLETLRGEVQEANALLAELQARLDKERREYEQAEEVFNRKLDIVEHLQARLTAATSDAERAELQASLDKGLTSLEAAERARNKEKAEFLKAEEIKNKAELVRDKKVQHFLEARRENGELLNAMETAKLNKKLAETDAALEARIAGLDSGSMEYDAARETIRRATREIEAEADTISMTSAALTKVDDVFKQDKHLAEAEAAVTKAALPGGGDASARLRAIQARAGRTPAAA